MFGLFDTPEEKLKKSVNKAIDKEIRIMGKESSIEFLEAMNVQFAIINVYESHTTHASLLAQGHGLPLSKTLSIIKDCVNDALLKNLSNGKDLLIP